MKTDAIVASEAFQREAMRSERIRGTILVAVRKSIERDLTAVIVKREPRLETRKEP